MLNRVARTLIWPGRLRRRLGALVLAGLVATGLAGPWPELPRPATTAGAASAGPRADEPVWTSIGPASTTGGQIPGGTNVSGPLNAVAPDPGDATGNTIHIGAVLGGVWKTTNRGRTWTPLTDEEASLAITDIVFDPTNSRRVYAATGDITTFNTSYGSSSNYYFGAGILYSPDAGASWQRLGAREFTGVATTELAISPDGMKLYVAASNGLWVGTRIEGERFFGQ